MKKILSLLFITLLISSCSFNSWDDLEKAKQDLWVVDIENNQELEEVKQDIVNKDVENLTTEDVLMDESIEENNSDIITEPTFKIEQLTADQFIELDDISNQLEKVTDSVEITWKTLTNVDKIIVNFQNRDSDFPIDNYTLTQFRSWDKTFTYNAKSQFKVLDFGTNEYVFEAYSGDKVSKLQLTIIMPNIEDSESASITDTSSEVTSDISYEKKLVWDENNQIYLSLPKSTSFWEALSAWDDTITYSKINWLEINIKSITSDDINCSNVTDYLTTNLWGWFYWNTCRDIIKDDGISFYVLKLDWEAYTYEKHYIDYKHGLYWVYVIKTNIEADKENISSDIALKNTELKEQNDIFSQVDLVDMLFKEIVR